jgi:hypothetical protein
MIVQSDGREEFSLCIFNNVETFKYGLSHALIVLDTIALSRIRRAAEGAGSPRQHKHRRCAGYIPR